MKQNEELTPQMLQMKEASESLLNLVVKNLCETPQKAIVSIVVNGTNSCLICISVDAKDYGKVIGQKGKIVKAIRTLLQAFAGRYRIRFLFEVSETNQ